MIPFIDKRYPTDPADRTYFGHSFGGLFGCYALFTRPDTFTRYIIGSPSLWWAKEQMLTLAEQYTSTHDDLKATVFIGIGALEEAPSSRMLGHRPRPAGARRPGIGEVPGHERRFGEVLGGGSRHAGRRIDAACVGPADCRIVSA